MTDSDLAVRVLDLGEMAVVGLEGDLAEDTAPLLDAELRAALDRSSTTIVLDCSLLRSVGRSEVAVLISANEEVRARHGRLVVRQPNERTRSVLQDSGLLDTVEVES